MDIKIRPNVSNISGPTQCISRLPSRVLRPLPKNIPADLDNSFKLIRYTQETSITTTRHYHTSAVWMLFPNPQRYLSKKPPTTLSTETSTQYTSSPIKMSKTYSMRHFTTCFSPLKTVYSTKLKTYQWVPAYQAS